MSERHLNIFAHIGFHCHEFGHILGFKDEYFLRDPTPFGYYCVMAEGGGNGPNLNGECPATLSPYYRIINGWITPIPISTDTTNLIAQYDYSSPKFFQIIAVEGKEKEYFIFETRLREGFDKYTPNDVSRFADQKGTLLVWKHTETLIDHAALIPADDVFDHGATDHLDFFPAFESNVQDFHDFTTPAPRLLSNNWKAHFALFGIRRVFSTDFTSIDSIKLDYGDLNLISQNTIWSGSIQVSKHLRITNGALLTIRPGTIVSFERPSDAPPFRITVRNNSIMQAIGKIDSPIVFNSASGNRSDWYGIQGTGNGLLQLSHCEIRNGFVGLTTPPENPNLQNLSFFNCQSGVRINSDGTIITNCDFENNYEGVVTNTDIHSYQILSSMFKNNVFSGITINSGVLDGAIISNCNFQGNGYFKIINKGGSPTILNNLFVGAGGNTAIIIENQNSTGIFPLVMNNTIANHDIGLYISEEGGIQSPTIKNNIFYLNAGSNFGVSGNATIVYNNIYNNDRETYTPPQFNFKQDPLFVNAEAGDYHLLKESPSIDAGDPSDGYTLEPLPNGKRVNQGRYGNTSEATKSIYIKSQSTWYGSFVLDQGATVMDNAVLCIDPGTQIMFNIGKGLSVAGKLIAKGEPNNRITFTSSNTNPSPGDWNGIVCFGGGPDTLTYCDIKYANNAVQLTNTSPYSYMAYDTLYNSGSSGVTVYNTSTAQPSLKMYQCTLNEDNVFVVSAKVNISRTKISDSNNNGIVIACGGKVYLDSSRIENNNGHGIDVIGYGSRVSLSPDEIKKGYNTVSQNGWNTGSEIYIEPSATALLGYTAQIFVRCDCGYEEEKIITSIPQLPILNSNCPSGCTPVYRYEARAGWNNVLNSYSNNCRLINNTSTSQVYARYNYWGTGTNMFCGYVDTAYQLSGPVYTPTKIDRNHYALDGIYNNPERIKILQWLRQLRSDIISDADNAIDALHQSALYVGPGGEYADALQISWDNLLNTIIGTHTIKRAKKLATVLRVQAKMDVGEYSQAIELADQMLSQNIDDGRWLYFQSRKILASVVLGDIVSAQSIFNSIESRGLQIDSTSIKMLRNYLTIVSTMPKGGTGFAGSTVKPAKQTAMAVPNEFTLEQNYPNPFNPMTVIKYQLPVNSQVTLKIYNVLGQEVKTLIDEVQDLGFNEVEWNSTNNAGNSIASGVYFYKLDAVSVNDPSRTFTKVKKMLLLR